MFVCRELPPGSASAVHLQLPLDAGDLRGEVRAHPAVHGRAQQKPVGHETGHQGAGGQLRQIRLMMVG